MHGRDSLGRPICRHCGGPRTPYGGRLRCIPCAKAKSQEWANANPQRRLEISRKWRTNNAARQLAMSKAWKKAHPDKVAEHDKRYDKGARQRLTTRYLRHLSKRQIGSAAYGDPSIAQLKREQLLLHRQLVEAKRAIKQRRS